MDIKSFKDFEILDNKQELGKGSSSKVFKIRSKMTGSIFALKQQNEWLKEELSQIKEEISVHSQISHDNIIKFYSSFYEKNTMNIVLEFAEKGNIFYKIRKNEFNEKEKQKIFKQVCEALYYLHKKNIVHRDIKPENILLDSKQNVKLCDFGCSKEVKLQRVTFCGTYEYMSPEVFEGKPQNKATDIWSLGIFLYELHHGYSPYRYMKTLDMYQAIQEQGLTFKEKLNPMVKDLIIKLLKKTPEERPSISLIMENPYIKKIQRKTLKRHFVSVDCNQIINKKRKTKKSRENFKSGIQIDFYSPRKETNLPKFKSLKRINSSRSLQQTSQRNISPKSIMKKFKEKNVEKNYQYSSQLFKKKLNKNITSKNKEFFKWDLSSKNSYSKKISNINGEFLKNFWAFSTQNSKLIK